MRYFVTGATGFVGSWVAQQLVQDKQDVCCLVRKTSNLKWLRDLPVEYHYGSLNDKASLREGIAGADYVLHIAGVTKALSAADYYAGNVDATENLLDVVEEVNPKVKMVVHVSSQAAVGPSPSAEPVDETFPPNPLTDYGRSKARAEDVVHRYMDRLPISILRPPAVYGPRDTDVFEVFKNVYNRLNLKIGNTDQVVSMVHVYDLAAGIIHAAKQSAAAGETYFICNEPPCTWSNVIADLESIMERKALNIPVPAPVAYAFAGLMEAGARLRKKPTILNRQKIKEVSSPFWVISGKKMADQLGFTCKLNITEGLKITYDWYKAQGWL